MDAVSGRAGQEEIGGDREERVLQSAGSPAGASFGGVGNQYVCAAFIVQVPGGESAVLVDVTIRAPLLVSGRCLPADIL
jgi:hypothetical protein